MSTIVQLVSYSQSNLGGLAVSYHDDGSFDTAQFIPQVVGHTGTFRFRECHALILHCGTCSAPDL